MRVKLGDVCERGTSNLKLSDVSEKNGEFSVFGASGYIGSVDFYQQGYPYVAVVKNWKGNVMPGKNFCNRYDAVSFTERQYIAKVSFLCSKIYEFGKIFYRRNHPAYIF